MISPPRLYSIWRHKANFCLVPEKGPPIDILSHKWYATNRRKRKNNNIYFYNAKFEQSVRQFNPFFAWHSPNCDRVNDFPQVFCFFWHWLECLFDDNMHFTYLAHPIRFRYVKCLSIVRQWVKSLIASIWIAKIYLFAFTDEWL